MKQLLLKWIFTCPLFFSFGIPMDEKTSNDFSMRMGNPCEMISEGRHLLKEGDLVVRLSHDPSSWFVRNFNHHDKKYTHAGIVLNIDGQPCIFHMIDGMESRDGKMKKDSLAGFSSPKQNLAYGIFRYDLSKEEIKRLKEIVLAFYNKGLRFDEAFNFLTDDRMYCSELVSKSLSAATGQRIRIEPEQLSSLEAGFLSAYTHLSFDYTSHLKIVPIDALYLNQSCRLIQEFKYR
jgi:hypothetical protein